jgi:predicted N-acetyltransferase YhbS
MSNEERLNLPVLLNKSHNRSAFDCGVLELNDYLQRYALQNQKKSAARTYVATRGNEVVGYYTLVYGSVAYEEAPEKVQAGLGKYPIPILLLARLAVALTERGKRLGEGLLKDALLRTLQAAEIAGLRAVLVHAKDETVKKFYERFGFEASPIDDLHLFLRIIDIQESILG